VLPGPHRREADEGVEMVGRGDQHRVDRLLLLEHHPEVFVDRARVVGRLGAVVLLDFGLHRAAAGLPLVVPALQVPRLGGVGERDDLGVIFLEESPGVGPPLAAGADDGDVHLVARRDELLAAEDMPRHDGEGGGRRGGRLDELSACTGRDRHLVLLETKQRVGPS
jgi:hypothetical protein